MATIDTSLNTNGAAADRNPYTAIAPAKHDIDKNMFLQLLVSQLRNQDPLNPSDGTQFIAQLAQFQQLEQSINAGQDIAAMLKDLDQLVAASTAVTQKT
jgi:flagellar basal-body rod modification protein FlgD